MSKGVTYAKAPRRKRQARDRSLRRTPPVRIKHMVGVVAALSLVGGLWHYGLPHVLFNYQYHTIGGQKYQTDCGYIGPYGGFERAAHAGSCPIVRFFRPDG